jgi:uncharacterized membrane protein YcaP (DUF421 family)
MTWWLMAIRAVLVLIFSIALFRLLDRRVFGKYAALDVVVSVLVGSTLSRGITGNAPFIPTLAAVAVLVGAHALLAHLAARYGWFDRLTKGRPILLLRDGHLDRHASHRHNIAEQDVLEALRTKGGRDLAQIEAAYLERSGAISIIRKPT